MTQGTEENYFTLNNPSINNKPQSTTADIIKVNNSNLLSRRQPNLIQPFELPSLTQLIPNTNEFMIDPILNNVSFIDTTLPLTINYPQTFIQPISDQRQRQSSNSSQSSNEKTYSFVTLPGTTQKKRPRRRYDEIERLYHCNWPNCSKSYGTLNHLNAHVSMQKHGPKRHPSEFKEMRKEWRKQKKENQVQKKKTDELFNQNNDFLNQSSFSLNPLPPNTLNGFY